MESKHKGSDNGGQVEDLKVMDELIPAAEWTADIEARNADVGLLVGSYVSKDTSGIEGALVGKVASYHGEKRLYTVIYEDGHREELDHLQISEIIVVDDDEEGSNSKLRCRKRKLETSRSSVLQSPDRRTKSKNALDGVETSSIGRLDSDTSEDSDASCSSCEYVEASASAASPEPLVLELPPSSGDIAVPEESISNLFSVYSFLRSFSVQLFLSPFQLSEFVGSLNCTVPNSLLDAIHLSLMRALWDHLQVLSSDGFELASKCLRYNDWNLLDALTWPAFVLEYLYIMGYMRNLGERGNGAMLLNAEYYCLPVSTKLKILQILCDDVLDSAEFRSELEMRENIEDDVEGEVDVSLLPEDQSRNVQSRTYKNSVSQSMHVLQASEKKLQQTPSSETTKADADADALSADIDGNSDECRLCGMDGTLICCDGCPFAYHSRCIGLNKAFLPDGPWFCPECMADKLAPMSLRVGRGIKGVVVFGIDAFGRLFLGTCNYLLVIGTSLNAEPFSRYYSQADVTKVLSSMSSGGENASIYDHICSEISKHWEITISSLEAGETKPVGGNKIYINSESSADFEAKAHSSLVNFSKQSEFNVATKLTELNSHEKLSSLTDARISSKNTAETVQKVLPGISARPSKQFTKDSVMMPALIAQRLTAQAISHCNSVNQNGNAYSSYGSIKNDALGMLDRGRHGSQIPIVQGGNDGALNGRSSFKPQSYVNNYIHGEIAASAAANLAILTNEESGYSEAHVSSHSRKNVAATIALQMQAFSGTKMYFLWPTFEKKLMDIPRERCGWCIACKGTSGNRKGCLLNLAVTNANKGSIQNINGLNPAKHDETHFPIIAAHIANMEASLHGLIVGSLLDAESNIQWRKQLREASSCRVLKILLLDFERSIRGIAFSGGWFKLINDGSDGPSDFSIAATGVCHAGPSQKRGPGRPRKQHDGSDGPSDISIAPTGACHTGPSQKRGPGRPRKQHDGSGGPPDFSIVLTGTGHGPSQKRGPGRPRKQHDGSDEFSDFSIAPTSACHAGPTHRNGSGRPRKQPVSSDSESTLSKDSQKDVQWWRGGKLSKVFLQNASLPCSLVRKAARQGGSKRIPSICYPENAARPRRSRQSAWRAAVQMCKNAAQLALQVRYLDANVRWKDLVPPEQTSLDGKELDGDVSAFRNAVICDKRFAEDKIVYAVTFSNQKYFTSRLMKNVIEKEIINGENSRLWFYENHIPLYLIKEYEEKTGGKNLPGLMTSVSHVRPKIRRKKKSLWKSIFAYLEHKRDQPPCASCKEDVNLRDATTCSICQAKCHKDCAIPLIDRKGVNLSFSITCKVCYHAKTAALNASRKGIINSQLSLRR